MEKDNNLLDKMKYKYKTSIVQIICSIIIDSFVFDHF